MFGSYLKKVMDKYSELLNAFWGARINRADNCGDDQIWRVRVGAAIGRLMSAADI
ncbi:MAG: hypothetical protein FWB71_01250 [Defluviitaleaceae bacterium]|nr:hypothetical protein [Defluviitaleaceae bacterium]